MWEWHCFNYSGTGIGYIYVGVMLNGIDFDFRRNLFYVLVGMALLYLCGNDADFINVGMVLILGGFSFMLEWYSILNSLIFWVTEFYFYFYNTFMGMP